MMRALREPNFGCGLSLLVVFSFACSERFFCGNSGFPRFSKANISSFQFHLEHADILEQVFKNSYPVFEFMIFTLQMLKNVSCNRNRQL